MIPAGVAHKGEAASPDLLIVGAYPGGRGPDMRVPGKGDREQATRQYRRGAPAGHRSGVRQVRPLIERWRASAQR